VGGGRQKPLVPESLRMEASRVRLRAHGNSGNRSPSGATRTRDFTDVDRMKQQATQAVGATCSNSAWGRPRAFVRPPMDSRRSATAS
jgi:hypothetical protein